MKQSYPLFETVMIDKTPYLRIAFDDKNEAHKEWLSEHIGCVEVENGSSSHDYPTDLVVEIPIIAFIEGYYVLERYHNLKQIVIDCSVSSEEFKRQKRSFFSQNIRINAPQECDDYMPNLYFTLHLSEWYSEREWFLEFSLDMLDIDDYIDAEDYADEITCVSELVEGVARRLCNTTDYCENPRQPLPPVLDWNGGWYRGQYNHGKYKLR